MMRQGFLCTLVAMGLAVATAHAAAPPLPPVPPPVPPLAPPPTQAPAPAQVPAQTPLAPQSSSAEIDGFRSAHFGMDAASVRAAIAADFHLSGASVHAAVNPVQRTDVLRIRVPDLVAGGGTAQIDYIFGYRSHALIEVNILWSAATDSRMTPAQLVANGSAISAYFARQGFSPQETVQNALLPDGNVLLFRTRDDAGRAVVLMLSGKRAPDSNGKGETLTPMALALVYAADPAHPDVFSLKKGSF